MQSNVQCNIVCLKWGGLYPASYTNILYQSVKRHLKRPFRFICCTENSKGLDKAIEVVPIPPNPAPDKMSVWPNIFLKLAIWQKGFADLKGPTLFLDVDVAIMDDMDCFFDYKPGKNCIIHNWVEIHKRLISGRPSIGNSSVFRFDPENSDYVFQTFLKEIDDALDREKYSTEQAFLTHAMVDYEWWPEDWVVSFKRKCQPFYPLNLIKTPKEPKTKILVFHGHPNPDEAIKGFKGKRLHHRTLPCKWIEKYWKYNPPTKNS